MTTPKKATRKSSHWEDRLRASLPKREVLAAHPWLKPVAHRLLDPQLWRLQHEAVARGVAIGLFWAFAFPVAQILLAVVFCVWWRGNIAVAAGLTLVTNPFTIGFWLWLSYRTGSLVLVAPPPAPVTENAGVMTWLASVGAPTLLGMGIFAVGGAAAGYIIVKLAWRVRIWFKRRHR